MATIDAGFERKRHARIKYELSLRGLSFAEIARRANLSLSAVSHASLGKTKSARVDALLAEALGTSAADLFPDRYFHQKGARP